MAFVAVPAVVATADELLGAARSLIDRETSALEADPAITVSCRPNCNACCEHAVVVTPAESRAIAVAVSELPASTQEMILSRARQVLARVAVEIRGDASDIIGLDEDFSRGYYALEEPCPLLVEGACSVRSVRPLVCREFLMSSAPEHCSDRSLEQAVRIRRRNEVSRGFGHVSSRFDEASPRLLPLALVEPFGPARTKPMSGPKLAVLFSQSR